MVRCECEEILEMLDLYIDNELLVETNNTVVQHLSHCADCSAEYERRTELRRLLKAAIAIDDDRNLEDEITARRRVELALDRGRRPWNARRIVWGVLAASLIIVLALGLYWRTRKASAPEVARNAEATPSAIPVADADRDAVLNHEACALTYPPDWTYDAQRVSRELTTPFAGLVDAVGRDHGSYKLIEGHTCSYQDRRYAHLIFRGNGHTVSVFIERDLPSQTQSALASQIEAESYAAYQVASVDTGVHRIFVVSDLSSADNLRLANEVIKPTLGFVRKLEVGPI